MTLQYSSSSGGQKYLFNITNVGVPIVISPSWIARHSPCCSTKLDKTKLDLNSKQEHSVDIVRSDRISSFYIAETSEATDKTSAELELMYFIKRNNICISDVPKWKSSIELDPRSSVVVQYFFSSSLFFILLCVPFFKLKQRINNWHIKLMIGSETHTKCTSAFL